MRTSLALALAVVVAAAGCKKENKDAKPAAKAADAAVAKADPMKGGNYGGKPAIAADSVKVVAATDGGAAAVPPPQAPTGPLASAAACDAAVKHVFDLMMKDREASAELKGMKPEDLQKQMTEASKECAEKKTTQTEIDCVMAANDTTALEKCDTLHKEDGDDDDRDNVAPAKASGGGTMSVEEGMKQLDKLVDATCACKDQKCIDDVQHDMSEKLGNMDKSQKPTDEQMAHVQKAMERMTECAMKVMAPAQPGSPAKK